MAQCGRVFGRDRSAVAVNAHVWSIESLQDLANASSEADDATGRRLGILNFPLLQRHNSGTPSELKLLWALIDSCAGSPRPSQVDVERGLERGLARLMLLEGRLRAQASRASGTRSNERPRENHDLVEEIRALREAVAELRAHTNAGKSAPLAQGFVKRRP